MVIQRTDDKRRDSRPRRFQFGLRGLFVVTTVLAIFCGIVFRLPEQLAVAVSLCLLVSVPVVLTVVLIHGRGYARTFSLGAMFPAGLMFLSLLLSEYGFDVLVWEAVDDYLSWHDHRLLLCVFLGAYSVLVVGHGLLAVAVHWLLDRGQAGERREPRCEETEP